MPDQPARTRNRSPRGQRFLPCILLTHSAGEPSIKGRASRHPKTWVFGVGRTSILQLPAWEPGAALNPKMEGRCLCLDEYPLVRLGLCDVDLPRWRSKTVSIKKTCNKSGSGFALARNGGHRPPELSPIHREKEAIAPA